MRSFQITSTKNTITTPLFRFVSFVPLWFYFIIKPITLVTTSVIPLFIRGLNIRNYYKHQLTLLIAISLVFITACTSQDEKSEPTLDLGGVPGILPTVPPAEVVALAQLADDATLEQGKTLYMQYCSECHGENGEGQFPEDPFNKGPDGRFGAPPHNDSGHTWHHDDDLLYDYVKNGGKGSPETFYEMPALGDVLTDDEIWAILSYIKSRWTEENRLIQAERTLQTRENN